MLRSASTLASRWIMFLSLFLILYGLAMVIAPEAMRTPVAAILFDNMADLRRDFVATGGSQSTFLNLLSGLLGTVTAGWAIQMAWIAYIPFQRRETWAWNALAMSVSVWAVLEFYYKLVAGINGMGLLAHFGLWIAFAVPLLLTYPIFHPAIPNDHKDRT